jgi:hypothetical protein
MNRIGTIDVSWPAFLEQFSSPSHKIAYLGALPQAPSAPTAQSVHSGVGFVAYTEPCLRFGLLHQGAIRAIGLSLRALLLQVHSQKVQRASVTRCWSTKAFGLI